MSVCVGTAVFVLRARLGPLTEPVHKLWITAPFLT
jgi:hypothetical protein